MQVIYDHASVTKGGSICPSQGGEQSMSVMEVLTLILVKTIVNDIKIFT